jgi:hypothetical protein
MCHTVLSLPSLSHHFGTTNLCTVEPCGPINILTVILKAGEMKCAPNVTNFRLVRCLCYCSTGADVRPGPETFTKEIILRLPFVKQVRRLAYIHQLPEQQFLRRHLYLRIWQDDLRMIS